MVFLKKGSCTGQQVMFNLATICDLEKYIYSLVSQKDLKSLVTQKKRIRGPDNFLLHCVKSPKTENARFTMLDYSAIL
jgi:hypothetical protein